MAEQDTAGVAQNEANTEHLAMTADIVAAFVGNNHVSINELPALITSVGESLGALVRGANPQPQQELTPAVPIRSSVKPDFITCLEDGAQMKTLKRYLMTKFGMTPQQYREKWGLPRDYPMVAPNYSKARSELAKNLGLGRKGAAARNKGNEQSPPSGQEQSGESNQDNVSQSRSNNGNGKRSQNSKATAQSGTAAIGTTANGKPRGGKSGKPRRTRAEMEALRASGQAKPKKARGAKKAETATA